MSLAASTWPEAIVVVAALAAGGLRRREDHPVKRRQVPKGRKKPRGYGEQPATVDEIVKRLRESPPRSKRRHQSQGRNR